MADNVLGTLFGDIANAIRSKTGDTATMKPSEFPTKILEIEVGGATETDIIPEQEFALTLNSQLGVYMASGFDLFSIKSGEKYYVVWGEETFTCTAVDGVFEGAPCVAIGNPYPVGGTNNNLPFVIGCVPNFEGHTLCVIVDLAGQTETKKVRVYQKASGDGWETLIEEQTITGEYNSLNLCNQAYFSDSTKMSRDNGGLSLYKVWFDGVAYPCSLYNYHYTFEREVFGKTEADGFVVGNPHMYKGMLGIQITCTDEHRYVEPFSIVLSSQPFMIVNDTKPHTIKIDCIKRPYAEE